MPKGPLGTSREKPSKDSLRKVDRTSGLEQSWLMCPVCMDYLLSPITTSCGHVFCEFCQVETLLLCKECPICRRPSKGDSAYPAPVMGQLVDEYLSASGCSEDRERYEQRKQRLADWKTQKQFEPLWIL